MREQMSAPCSRSKENAWLFAVISDESASTSRRRWDWLKLDIDGAGTRIRVTICFRCNVLMAIKPYCNASVRKRTALSGTAWDNTRSLGRSDGLEYAEIFEGEPGTSKRTRLSVRGGILRKQRVIHKETEEATLPDDSRHRRLCAAKRREAIWADKRHCHPALSNPHHQTGGWRVDGRNDGAYLAILEVSDAFPPPERTNAGVRAHPP